MSTAPLLEPTGHSSRTGSAARVADLFERHGRMVYGICRVMLRDPHDAEDAMQQAFLSAYRALLNGAAVRDDGAWISTIARNECRARISAGMRAPLPLTDEDLAAIEWPVDEVERSMHGDVVRAALAELPKRQREAVVLRDLYGLRYAEVATALGLSRPATEALLFRARRTLRQRIRPAIATTLTVPIAVQDALAQSIPGFGVGSGTIAAGAAGGGILAKLAAGPIGVKVATAVVAVTTVGTVGAVDSEHGGRRGADRSAQPAMAGTTLDARDDSSGPSRTGSRVDDRGDPGKVDRVSVSGSRSRGEARGPSSDDGGGSRDSSGPGSSSGSTGDVSGRGGGRAEDAVTAGGTEAPSSSGRGPGSAAVESGSSGSGSNGSGTSGSTSSGSSGSGATGSGASGTGSSGSDSGGSGTSDSSSSGSSDDKPDD